MKGQPRDYYVRGEVLQMEEDATHEFKGHCAIAHEDVRDFNTKQPVSKAVCGFLNTGQGGIVFLGVADNGAVLGLNLTVYAKDHIVGSLDDTLGRYLPPVERHRYKVKFVPVVESNASEEEIREVLEYHSSSELNVDEEKRKQPHNLQTIRYCWCHIERLALVERGFIPARFIVEIHVKKWKPTDVRNRYPVGVMRGHPVHQDEKGLVYCRNHASVSQLTLSDVRQLARTNVEHHYRAEMQRLQSELAGLDKL